MYPCVPNVIYLFIYFFFEKFIELYETQCAIHAVRDHLEALHFSFLQSVKTHQLMFFLCVCEVGGPNMKLLL